jgi:hypothetical protein
MRRNSVKPKRSTFRAGVSLFVVLALAATACVCTSLSSLVPSTGGISGQYDAGDGLDTTKVDTISVGESKSDSLGGIFEAHNYTFEGTAGQTVTITATAVGDTDPRVYLIDPSGNKIAEDDDGGGGYNASLTFTLPSTGTYTIRVDVFTAGDFTLTLN